MSDQYKYLDTMETTKIQAHLVKSPSVRKVVSSQKRSIIRIYKTDGAGTFSYEGGATDEATTFSEVGVWFSIRNRWNIRNQDICRTCCWYIHIQRNGRRIILLRLQKNTATLTLSGETTASTQRVRWFWNSYTQKDIKVVTGVVYLWLDLVLSLDLVLLQNQHSIPSAARAILTDISGVAETRYFKYSKTSFHLVHSQYLENLLIQISTSHQHTLVLEMLPSLVLQGEGTTHRDWCWYCNTFWICNTQIYSRRSRRNSPLRHKGASAPATQSSLRILRRRQRSRHIWYYNNIWYWHLPENSNIWILWRRQRSRHIRWIYILQYSSRTSICRLHSFNWYWCCSPLPDRWNCYSNHSPSPTTQLKEDSKDLQVSKESLSRATYVGIGQVNTFGDCSTTEYLSLRTR